jgi:diguanylate cyclase (GGDEF)-like protein
MSDQRSVAEGAPARFGSAGEAMHAVSRLLRQGTAAGGPAAVGDELVREARAFFRVTRGLLLTVSELEGRVEVVAMDPEAPRPEDLLAIVDLPPVAAVIDDGEPVRVGGDGAVALGRAIGAGERARSVLLLPLRLRGTVSYVLALADEREREFTAEEAEVAGAFAAAAAAGLAQLQLAADHAAQTARQAALARAAKSLNDTLDLNRVLVRICEESTSILDGDCAVVYVGDGREGLRMEAVLGLPPEAIGTRLEPGEGLAGRAVERGESLLTNDYPAIASRSASQFLGDVQSSLAVPMHWGGELRGVLSVGYRRRHLVTRDHLGLLEAFAEIAAAASRNASAHAGLAMAARTDALTGCLNHAALHDALGRELERCRRTGHKLSLAVVDLDDFKQVNERFGHLAGDEVLRAVGGGLRQGVRAYDLVARYGGDEFAIVAIGAGEEVALGVTSRALKRVTRAVRERRLPESTGQATAGVAEWDRAETSARLIERADRALLFAKHEDRRGAAMPAGGVPGSFLPAAGGRGAPVRLDRREEGLWPDRAREQTDRLRKRTRQLVLANALGARLAAMTDPAEIARAAVEELHRTFGFYLCAVIRIRDDGYVEGAAGVGEAFERLVDQKGWSQPRDAGLIGRCLRERRAVVCGNVAADPEYRATDETEAVQSELVVPLVVGGRLWGAINIEEVARDAFDEDDVRAVEAVAGQVGSALLSATEYERLERAYQQAQEALSEAR